MTNTSREKELARAAAKREGEKRAARRRRTLRKIGVLVAIAAVIGGAVFLLLKGGEDKPKAHSQPPTAPPLRPTAAPVPGFPCYQDAPAVIPAKFNSDKPPPMSIDVNKNYLVSMNTSCGSMKFKLLPQQAPATVNNFVYLVDKHWYNGLTFHRIANDIDVIQGGDPTCNGDNPLCGSGNAGYTFKDEVTGKEKYVPGTVAMANSGPDTNGSQFFIVTGPKAKSLPSDYTIFGQLVGKASFDTAAKIQSVPLKEATQQPLAPVWIRGVKIKESK